MLAPPELLDRQCCPFQSNLVRKMSIFQTPFFTCPSRRTSLVAERQNRGDTRAGGSPGPQAACSLLLATVFRSILFTATLLALTVPLLLLLRWARARAG